MFEFVSDLKGMGGMFYITHSHDERMHADVHLTLDMKS